MQIVHVTVKMQPHVICKIKISQKLGGFGGLPPILKTPLTSTSPFPLRRFGVNALSLDLEKYLTGY
jgi:hypothetical protein